MFDQIPEPLSPPEQKKVEDLVTKAKARLILHHPFFGMAVSKRTIMYDYNTSTASMDAVGQMRLNPHFVAQQPDLLQNTIFLLAHEAMHFMLCHSTRRGARDPEMWNISADQIINDILIEAKVGKFIEGGCHFDGARYKATEELYNDPPEDTGGGAGGGIGLDIGDPVDAQGKPLDESKIKEIEAKAKVEAIQSATLAKQKGKLPASLERMIDELVNVKTPWYDKLERYFNSKLKDGRSWKRPNRRFIGRGLYLPGDDYVPRMGNVVFGIDTSGSIQQEELNVFGGHVNRIIEQCNPKSVTVIYCDDEIAHVDTYEPEEFPIKLTAHGGGGTAFDPVFDYIDEHDLDPEVVVYFTDGYGNQNDFTSKHDTVWLTTHSPNFDWGQVIEFDVDA